MDTLHKTNTAGLSVQAYVCLQVRREPKAAELEKGSAIIADFAAGLPHLDAALGALALANHDNFHSKRQTVQSIERVFGFAEEHLQIVDRADGRGLALLPSVPLCLYAVELRGVDFIGPGVPGGTYERTGHSAPRGSTVPSDP